MKNKLEGCVIVIAATALLIFLCLTALVAFELISIAFGEHPAIILGPLAAYIVWVAVRSERFRQGLGAVAWKFPLARRAADRRYRKTLERREAELRQEILEIQIREMRTVESAKTELAVTASEINNAENEQHLRNRKLLRIAAKRIQEIVYTAEAAAKNRRSNHSKSDSRLGHERKQKKD